MENLAIRGGGEFLKIPQIPIKIEVVAFALEVAIAALVSPRPGRIEGAAVLAVR